MRQYVNQRTVAGTMLFLVIFLGTLVYTGSVTAENGLVIRDREPGLGMTSRVPKDPPIEMLQYHYWPALVDYDRGAYRAAEANMNYVIARPGYFTQYPQHRQSMSHAHYIRGMIYMYHAEGPRRYIAAKQDFERSIQWNPQNYVAYLELARLLGKIGLKDMAMSVLQRLAELKPGEEITRQASQEVSLLRSDKSK